ncbi:MAG: metallophosphoesterase, partial [Bdellovibrionales bacterium]|nr:metallophosphoesterase [Bdellovibrionales bacterium]
MFPWYNINMKLAWITDPHFELLQPFAPREFTRCVKEETGCDALLVSGDIANGPGLKHTLEEMTQGAAGCPIYFVLGNHDYYDMKID